MEKFPSKLKNLLLNPKIIFGIYLVVSAVCAVVKYFNGPNAYNNYRLFKYVFLHSLEQKNLYLEYPDIYFDANHYGIFFGILIAPFALLPDWLGMPLWNVANAALLVYAFRSLPFSENKKAILGWLCLQEFITAALSIQFNVGLTGLIILSATWIYRRKEVSSALAILVGTFVKLYGIVGLSAFFFVRNNAKFIFALLLGGTLFFVLPMIWSGADFTIQSYADWYASLSLKNSLNQSLTNRQDYSVMGLFRRSFSDATLPTLPFLLGGLVLFGLPYLRVKEFQNRAFQLMILASTLLFTVLFSSGSESPTYIIAVAGVGVWFLLKKKPSMLDWALLIFVLLITCFGFSDLFPKTFKENVMVRYALKALPCLLVWLKIVFELLRCNFARNYSVIE